MRKLYGQTMRSYQTWVRIRQRCREKPEYVSRGISVCSRWLSFDNFYADMGDRPDGMSIDRINNDGDYEPSNCRWATPKQQARNRSNNRLVLVGDQHMTLADVCERFKINRELVKWRLENNTWGNGTQWVDATGTPA